MLNRQSGVYEAENSPSPARLEPTISQLHALTTKLRERDTSHLMLQDTCSGGKGIL